MFSAMSPKIVVLWTDAVLWSLAALLLVYGAHVLRQPLLRHSWRSTWAP